MGALLRAGLGRDWRAGPPGPRASSLSPSPRALLHRPPHPTPALTGPPAVGLLTQRRDPQLPEAPRRSPGHPCRAPGPPTFRGSGCGRPGSSPAPRALPAGPPRPASRAPTLPASPAPIPGLRSSQPGWPRPEALSWAASLFGSWPLFSSELTEPIKSELGAAGLLPGDSCREGRGGSQSRVCPPLPGLPPWGLSQVLLFPSFLHGSGPGRHWPVGAPRDSRHKPL